MSSRSTKDRKGDHSSKKRKTHNEEHRKDKKRRESKKGVRVLDDDADDDVWIEKNIDIDGNNVRRTLITFKGDNHAAI